MDEEKPNFLPQEQAYSYEENDDVWELYLGRGPMTHGLKVIKIQKRHPDGSSLPWAMYWPSKEQSEAIVNGLNSSVSMANAVKWMNRPRPPEQAWEHNTVEQEGGRYHHQCPSCKRWAHRCSSCSWMSPEEEAYCSENCWKAAGSPELSGDEDATVS